MNFTKRDILCILFLFFLSTFINSFTIGVENKKRHNVKKYTNKFKLKEGTLILINGANSSQGNVLILHKGIWGSVCDDDWDINDAKVACRQLGFKGVHRVTHNSYFGKAADQIWIDNLFCNGDETYLSDCHFERWGVHDCDNTEAAGVICNTMENTLSTNKNKLLKKSKSRIKDRLQSNIKVRLRGGRNLEEGRVEVKYNNSDWGVICGDGWSILEAMVTCRMLGLNYARYAAQINFFGGDKSKILLSGVECRGDEKTLSQCSINPRQCLGDKDLIAGVMCTTNLPDLIIDTEELMKSSYLEDRELYFLQCAMEENCLASNAYRIQKSKKLNWYLEMRRLLRFTAKITNIGNVAFRPFVPKHLWEYHQCHMHFHSMEVFSTFDVLDHNRLKVAEGHKASFCLEDNYCFGDSTPFYNCANYGDQGISVNCSDVYRHNIDCQWIDITELNPGTYLFKVSINPEFKVPEMTFSNNVAICLMDYTKTSVLIYNCTHQHP